MPITEAAVQSFLQKVSAAREITSRKMFGGLGIYHNGVFFAVIDDDRLYFKIDEATIPTYEAAGMEQWIIPEMGPMPYYEVPPHLLDKPEELGKWIDESVAAAQRRKAKSKSKKK